MKGCKGGDHGPGVGGHQHLPLQPRGRGGGCEHQQGVIPREEWVVPRKVPGPSNPCGHRAAAAAGAPSPLLPPCLIQQCHCAGAKEGRQGQCTQPTPTLLLLPADQGCPTPRASQPTHPGGCAIKGREPRGTRQCASVPKHPRCGAYSTPPPTHPHYHPSAPTGVTAPQQHPTAQPVLGQEHSDETPPPCLTECRVRGCPPPEAQGLKNHAPPGVRAGDGPRVQAGPIRFHAGAYDPPPVRVPRGGAVGGHDASAYGGA